MPTKMISIDILKQLQHKLFNTAKPSILIEHKFSKQRLNLSSIAEQAKNELANEYTPWIFNDKLLKSITSYKPIPLSKYLLFKSNGTLSAKFNTLKRKQDAQIKEFGYSNLHFIPLFISWQWQQKNYTSPFLLFPCKLEYAGSNTNRFLLQAKTVFINPVLRAFLLENVDIKLPLEVNLEKKSIEDLIREFRQFFNKKDSFKYSFLRDQISIGFYIYQHTHLINDYKRIISKQIAAPEWEKSNNLIKNSSSNFFNVLPSDESQNKVISKAFKGKSLVVEGPPGTGKSQTIVNILANAMANDLKVLFVSEKKAALDVVYSRMKKVGLHLQTIQMFNSKEDKKQLYEDLNKALKQSKNYAFKSDVAYRDREEILKKIKKIKEFFNKNDAFWLQKPPNSSLNYNQVFNLYAQHVYNKPKVNNNKKINKLSFDKWLKYKKTVFRLDQVLQQNGIIDITKTPLHALSKKGLRGLKKALTKENWEVLLEDVKTLKSFLKIFNLPKNSDIKTLLLSYEKVLENSLKLLKTKILEKVHEPSNKLIELIEEYKRTQKQIAMLEPNQTIWKNNLGTHELKKHLRNLKALKGKPLPKCYKKYRNAQKLFSSNYKPVERASYTFLIENRILYLEALERKNFLKNEAKQLLNISLEEYIFLYNFWGKSMPDNLKNYLVVNQEAEEFINKVLKSLSAVLNAISFFNCKENIDAIEKVLANLLSSYTKYSSAVVPLLKVYKNKALKHFLLANELHINNINKAFIAEAYKIIESDIKRQAISIDNINENIREYLKLNDDLLKLNIKIIETEQENKIYTLLRNSMKLDNKHESKGLKYLIKEGRKKHRSASLRGLLNSNVENLLLHIKPIWMMSTTSASESIPIESPLFDIVIFDEASQLPLEKSLPIMYRAKKVLVFGDTYQLPPMTFFKKKEKENNRIPSSLLTFAKQEFKSKKLYWHYRSFNQSLMAVSNRLFYKNRLKEVVAKEANTNTLSEIVVKSSSIAAHTYNRCIQQAITHHFLPEAVYENRKNQFEASYVAELLKHFLLSSQLKSIGIVTLSIPQQEAIENAIKKANYFGKSIDDLEQEKKKKHPSYLPYFIKNLENVQGDERDIIIISTGYGFNKNKKLLFQFGPINSSYGAKRLNVLFTRARKHLIVVSSIKASDINASENYGLQVLKTYLQFSENASTLNFEKAAKDLQVNPIKSYEYIYNSFQFSNEVSVYLKDKNYVVKKHQFQNPHTILIGVRKTEDIYFTKGILIENGIKESKSNTLSQLSIIQAHHFFSWNLIKVPLLDWVFYKKETQAYISDFLEKKSVEKVEKEAKESKLNVFKQIPLTYTRLEKTGRRSELFWEIAIRKSDLLINTGQVGTEGKSSIQICESVADAIKAKRKWIKLKEKNGYRRV